MARTEKVICDKCGAEEEFKVKYPAGWGLLETYKPTNRYELCPKCTKEASPKS